MPSEGRKCRPATRSSINHISYFGQTEFDKKNNATQQGLSKQFVCSFSSGIPAAAAAVLSTAASPDFSSNVRPDSTRLVVASTNPGITATAKGLKQGVASDSVPMPPFHGLSPSLLEVNASAL